MKPNLCYLRTGNGFPELCIQRTMNDELEVFALSPGQCDNLLLRLVHCVVRMRGHDKE